MPFGSMAGHELVEVQVLLLADQVLDPVTDLEQLLARRRPSGESCVDAGGHLVLQGGHPDLEELVEVGEKMAQNFTRSSSGVPGSAASASTRALKSSQESSRFRSRGGGPSAGSTRDDTPFSVVQQGESRGRRVAAGRPR